MTATTNNPPYALYDVRDHCWLGDEHGVKTYDDWEIVRMAATVIGEQIGRLVRPAPYDGSAKKLKDEIPVLMTGEQAVKRVEDGA